MTKPGFNDSVLGIGYLRQYFVLLIFMIGTMVLLRFSVTFLVSKAAAYDKKIKPHHRKKNADSFYYGCLGFHFVDSRTSYSDFYLVLFHHIFTSVLMFLAVRFPFFGLGSVYFLFLFDIGDVFLEFAKFFRYIKVKLPLLGEWFLSYLCFSLLVPVWYIGRCIIYPLVVIRCIYYEYYIPSKASGEDVAPTLTLLPLNVIIRIMCIIWGVMIYKTLKRALVGKG
jgi:hypothetical protein